MLAAQVAGMSVTKVQYVFITYALIRLSKTYIIYKTLRFCEFTRLKAC